MPFVGRKCLGDADTEWQLLLPFHLHPLTGTVVGVPFPQFLSVWLCLSSTVHSRVGGLSWFIPVYYQLVLLLTAPSSVALHGVLRGGFRIDVLSVGVAKPGELSSVQRLQQELMLSNQGIHLLSHVFPSSIIL